MTIATVEQYLIDTLKTTFGATLKTVESLPADWDDDTFRRVLRLTPGLFVVFGGGQRNDDETDRGHVVIDARWGIVAATAHAGGELARRRGDKLEIGAYDIIQRATRTLEGHGVPDHGEIRVDSVENLFSADLDKQGTAIYALQLTLPMYLYSDGDTENTLDDFVTWHNDIDSSPSNDTLEASDTVTLEQA
jgi:phage gp37-like protein